MDQVFFKKNMFCKPNPGVQKNEEKKRIQGREGGMVDTTCMRHNLDNLIIESDCCKLAAISSTYGTCAIHHAL